jgi:hypothetical protein
MEFPIAGWKRSKKTRRSKRRQSRRTHVEQLEQRLVLASMPNLMLSAAPGADGGNPLSIATSPSGVEYGSGYIMLAGAAMTGDDFGIAFGQSPIWSNKPGAASGDLGAGIFMAEMPQLISSVS